MNFPELLLLFLIVLLVESPWIFLLWRSQRHHLLLEARKHQKLLSLYSQTNKDLNETIQVQGNLMNQISNQALNLLAAKDPMTFQALSITQPQTHSQISSDLEKIDTEAQEQMDEIIRVRGFLSPDEALYFREEEGLEVSDKLIRD